MWVCVQAHAPAPKGSLNRLAKMLCAASLTARRWISKLAVLSFLFTSMKGNAMSDTPSETFVALGEDLSKSMHQAAAQAKPVLSQMAHQVNERLHDLAHHSQEAALEAKHKIEDQARKATSTAEHCIRQAPFKSMAVAVGVGLLTGVVTTWLMRERRH